MKVGASWNEGYEVLFILEITKGAKKPSRPILGHVYHLVPDVEGLWKGQKKKLKLWKIDKKTRLEDASRTDE
ncbi:hypothetical protein Tco_1080971 [Tanacetum coccineum]|uniref:Uncharacterized protein n=1 Tax=Tanacetum coccineum TaxID=301880 RepID=A0ABQ5HXD7_9ASTR